MAAGRLVVAGRLMVARRWLAAAELRLVEAADLKSIAPKKITVNWQVKDARNRKR